MPPSGDPSGYLPATSYFSQEMRVSTAVTPTLADLDGDGRMDLVLRSKYGNAGGPPGFQGIQAWHNTVSGWERFATDPLQIDDGLGNLSALKTDGGLAIADIDNDGKLEVIATASTDGDGTSFKAWRLDGGALHELTGTDNPLYGVTLPDTNKVLDSIPGAVSIVDYNGDGRLDIVVGSDRDDAGIWAFTNTGTGFAADTNTFADVTFADQHRIAPGFTDLDGDGHLDMVIGSQPSTMPGKYGQGEIAAWHYNTVTDKFEAAATDPFAGITVNREATPVFIDLDGDGREDMVVGDLYGRLSAYHREADGSFTALDNPGSIQGFAGLPSFIDLDGDGKLDLVPSVMGAAFGGQTSWAPMRNTGSGFVPFDTNPFTSSPSSSGRALAVDLDGDGDKDIVFAGGGVYGGAANTQVFENQDGSYVATATDPFAGVSGNHQWVDVDVADLNGDGRDDLVVLDSNTSSFLALLATAGGFVEDTGNPLNGLSGSGGGAPLTGFARVDLDNDGDEDVVVTNLLSQVMCYENLGDHFTAFAANPISGGGPIGSLPFLTGPVFTDVDGDGSLDFVGTNASLLGTKYGDPATVLAAQSPAVWLHKAGGWEQAAEADNPYRTLDIRPFAFPMLAFADLDGDGHVEAVQSEKYGQAHLVGVVGLQLSLGSAQPEAMDGSTDDDIIRGFGGTDTINGMDGDDVLAGGAGADVLNGGAGSDTADYNDSGVAVRVSLVTNRGSGGDAEGDTLTSIENLGGSAFDDGLRGNAGDNTLEGRDGNDSLYGGDGADTLSGGAGDDRLFGEVGDDSLDGGDGQDALRGGSGDDVLAGGGGNDTLYGEDGADTLLGGDGADLLQGGIGADSLDGGAGADTIRADEGNDTIRGGDDADLILGGAGADLIQGGLGADTLLGEAGADVFHFASAVEGGDRILGYNKAEDGIEVSAAGFGGGLVEGEAAAFVGNLTGLASSASGTGQFVWETDARVLWWDADGAGGTDAVKIATFVGIVLGGHGITAGEITVVA